VNSYFQTFISDNQEIALSRKIAWDLPVNSGGFVVKGAAWNLTRMSLASPPPTHWLNDLGTDARTVKVLNSLPPKGPQREYCKKPLSTAWQDLIKACVIDRIFARQHTAQHVVEAIARALRVLGTCADRHEPWEVTSDDVLLAFEMAKLVQPSGYLANRVFGVIADVLDFNHLTDASPLSPSLTRERTAAVKRAKFAKSADELRDDLAARKSAEKLPSRRALWELVRIVFTEKPKSFLDVLRFAEVRMLILTGLRAGEIARLPADWRRSREYYDHKGTPAGAVGGYSHSLLLRYFGEKQRASKEGGGVLFESTQHVPLIFEEIVSSNRRPAAVNRV